MNLSVAYALWGGCDGNATLAVTADALRSRLNPKGWVGVILLLAGMVMIRICLRRRCLSVQAIPALILRQCFQLIAKAGDGYKRGYRRASDLYNPQGRAFVRQ